MRKQCRRNKHFFKWRRSATANFYGNITLNFYGNITSNFYGNITPNFYGNIAPNFYGNITPNLAPSKEDLICDYFTGQGYKYIKKSF
jgi:hypothetical protein